MMAPPESSARLEIEVKFHVDDLPHWRQKLLDLGAEQENERTHEYNVRYDLPWDGLRRAGKLLRLRQDDGVRLTFKGPAPEAAQSEARVREELEIHIDDFDQTHLLLQRVGFEPRQVYEKYRETFTLSQLEVVLDEMPFGDFLELEGEESEIRRAANQLGLDWGQRILTNYLALMEYTRQHYELDFDDLTFERFASDEYPIGPVLAALRQQGKTVADDDPAPTDQE